MITEQKECKHHGLTAFSKRTRGDWRCLLCNSEYVSNTRAAVRGSLISRRGGKCEKCGYSKCQDALCFHHLRDKKFALNKTNLLCKSKEEIEEEFKKCILLCANCHAEEHNMTRCN